MKIELHAIQNFAPSCLNRDDTNSPKDCEFGGYRRARISSQCLKRAMRHHPVFAATVGDAIGVRSRRLIGELTSRLTADDRDHEAASRAATAVIDALVGDVGNDGRTAVGIYLGGSELDAIRDGVIGEWEAFSADADKAAKDLAKILIKQFKSVAGAVDIALFGRMIAHTADLNIDAACQVAHAISTHKASMEMDFFTAVDDLQPDEDPGAGMMGTVEFNSSCFYRYALIDLPQLVKNLDGDQALAARTVDGFMRAFVQAIPSAKQNSMAAQNPPSFIMAVVRNAGVPCSLANAFERPVRPDERKGKGLVDASIESLDTYWGAVNSMYGGDGISSVSVCCLGDSELANLNGASVATTDKLYGAVMAAISAGEGGEDA